MTTLFDPERIIVRIKTFKKKTTEKRDDEKQSYRKRVKE
jgi:hypothetical protein